MYPSGFNGLSLGKIVGGLSKTLNIVNQALPLYKQIRPIISNAGSILNIFREFNKPDVLVTAKKNDTPKSTVEAKIMKSNPLNMPTFFQ